MCNISPSSVTSVSGAIFALAICALTANASTSVAAPAVTLDQIADAWIERQAQFDTVSVKWVDKRVTPKGGMGRIGDSLPGMGVITDGDVPSSDVVHKCERTIIFRGDDTWYSYKKPVWFDGGSGDEFFLNRATLVFKDGEFRDLRKVDAEVPFPMMGSIRNTRAIRMKAVLVPLIVHFRPESFGVVERLENYSVTSEQRTFDGSTCIVLVRNPASAQGVRRTLWVDIDNGFIARRWIHELDDQVVHERNAYYDQEPVTGLLVPTRWNLAMYRGDGTLYMAYELDSIEYEVNEAITRSLSLEFPPGTLIRDYREEELRSDYIVLADGSWRLRGAAEGSPEGRSLWFFIVSVLTLAALVGVLVWRAWVGISSRRDLV